MPKTCEWSNDLRLRVIEKREDGLSFGRISHDLHISKSTAINIFQKNRRTGTVENEERSGRPKRLSDRNSRHLKLHVIRNRQQSLSNIMNFANTLLPEGNVSKSTVRRELHSQKLFKRVSIKKPYVNALNRERRVMWVREREQWNMDRWRQIIWSDEMAVATGTMQQRQLVWRRPGEKMLPTCMATTMKSGSLTFQFWGCITWDGVAALVDLPQGITLNANILIDILQQHVAQMNNIDEYIFQMDNAPAHRSRLVNNWFQNHHITQLPWPAQSPDLSPIENIWSILKYRLSKMNLINHQRNTIIAAVHEIWDSITQAEIRTIIQSMPRRCEQIIHSRGLPIDY